MQEMVRSCAKCGACRSVCPLIEVDRMETVVARGKIEVIRRDLLGELTASRSEMNEFLDNCLLCGRCEIRCPNQVKTVEVFSRARDFHAGSRENFFGKKAFVKALGMPPSTIRVASFLGRGFFHLAAEKIPSSSGIFYRFPTLASKGNRMFPEIPRRSFLDRWGKSAEDIAGEEPDLLFTGCVFNYIYTDVLDGTYGTIRGNHERLNFAAPADQVCCGLPALGAGDLQGALEVSKKNIELFTRLNKGKIVFPCGSCLYMVKKVYPALLSGTDFHAKSLSVAERCMDYESFVTDLENLRAEPSSSYKGEKIAYHRPCHLMSIPGAIEGAESLLRSVFGRQFVEMRGADKCCGFGGTFNLVAYEKSVKMGLSKIEYAEESGTDIVVTSCSGCVHHLKESVARSRSRIRVMHVGELLHAGM